MRRLWIYVVDYSFALKLWMRSLLTTHDDSQLLTGTLAPVVLLPGVYESWRFLRPLATRIHSLGHPVHVVRQLGRNVRSVPTAAARAQRYLDEHDLRNVVLVAHSKGGLIGKHMMLLDDTSGRIDRLVAIATPFGGTRYARYMLDPALRAFRSTERTLALLAANAEVNGRIVSIYGDDDTHIPEGCELPGATNLEFPVSGHFGVLADERVLAAVDAAVG
jgi:pimeloyl-ACP methyl ester carboxylesterase